MRRRPDKCPQCGSPRVAEIVYGLPDPALVDADSEADVETERFVLGAFSDAGRLVGRLTGIPENRRGAFASMFAFSNSVFIGVPVSLAETLAPEFHRRGESLFSPDRFHPNSAGYELAAGLLLPSVCVALGVWDELPEDRAGDHAVAAGVDDDEAATEKVDADEVDSAVPDTAVPDTGTAGADDVGDVGDDEAAGSHRDSVVARLSRRLTDFVRTHEDAPGRGENAFLHNEDVDGDPENTVDAREAADTLRRRSRILRVARPHRDSPDPAD